MLLKYHLVILFIKLTKLLFNLPFIKECLFGDDVSGVAATSSA